MSAKWLLTVLVMLISAKLTPSASHKISALERVRLVVPKQGIVKATISFGSRCSTLQARTATSKARQLSSPPEMPSTAHLAWVCSMRLARPSAWMRRISSQRSARAAVSWGTNGVGETCRVRASSTGGSSNSTRVYPAVSGIKVVLRWRSCTMRSRSSSVIAVPPSKGAVSASRVPFSAIRLCPAKVISVVLSPWPASA